MARSPAPWPEAWKQEYAETIGQALGRTQRKPDGAARMEVFRRGFPRYWAKGQVTPCTQAEYNLRKAKIRWFCETLAEEALPSPAEKAMLEDQFRDLCDWATDYLRARFPFLRADCVEQGKQAALREFGEDLAAPLVPVFRKPLSPDQLQAIKASWARSCTRWFFTWRHVRYDGAGPDYPCDPPALADHPHSVFTRRCLNYLPGMIWPVVEKPPVYVLEALKEVNTEKDARVRGNRQALEQERSLALRFSNQIEQAEQWSFVLTALLETSRPDEKAGPRSRGPAKGGDAYDLTSEP
jgi:hypothetical protein